MKTRFKVTGLLVVAQLLVAGGFVGQGERIAAQDPPTAPGTVDGYAIVADGTGATAFGWNGSDNTVSGPVVSGGGILLNGKRNQYLEPVTYTTTFTSYGTTTFAVPPTQAVAPVVDDPTTDYAPGGALQQFSAGNGRWFDHTADCANGTWGLYGTTITLQTGVHWVPCNLTVGAQRLSGSATIVSTGRITINGTVVALHPTPGGRHSIISAATGNAVAFNTSGATVSGTVTAANGTIYINGSDSTFGCGLHADTVTIGGSRIAVDGNGPGCADADQIDPACTTASPDVLLGLPGTAIVGTPEDDVITGTSGDDVICALAGNDTIDGGGGNDVIHAGGGDDHITTAAGNDRINAGDGNDHVVSGDGDDVVDGLAGNDTMDLGTGTDRGYGHAGDDTITAGDGDDVADGGAGNDTAAGGPGADICTNNETETGCETGLDGVDPLTAGVSFDFAEPGPLTFSHSNDSLGVDLTIDSAGGLTTLDVEVEPAYRYATVPMTPVLASVPVDITVPDTAAPINGAELSLAWDPELLGAFHPALLRIYTFDTDAGLWLPVEGDQTVDTATGTVTAHLEHFSVYAILKIAAPSDWAQVFAQLPVRCVAGPGGGGVDLDVAFVIDQSGSMNTYDPQDRRVEAARAFLAEMSDDDRATVIGFNSSAIDRAPLLLVGDNRTVLENAIDATGTAGGGTAFTAPMTLAINRLAAVATQDRLRVIVLLTDGQGSYNSSLTTQAANAGIEIYTVGLGSAVDANLLTAMAAGTGGTYRALASADDLPALYRELAQDLTNNRADDDTDLIPDCVERNGAFVPQRNIDYGTGTAFTLGPSFITTIEPDPDSDDDDLIDGAELSARRFDDNPALAAEYSYLVDQGLEEYYKFNSDPNAPDTDGDDIDDYTEVLNDLDPTSYSIGVETDIDSLDYPPFTLFRSAIADDLDPFQRLNYNIDGTGRISISKLVYTQTPVEFQIDGDCVSNCQPLIDRAVEWDDGNGNGICFRGIGDCVDDNDQIRTLMRAAIRAQGIFTDDGKQLTEQYVREQSLLLCVLWSADVAGCSDNLETLEIEAIDIDGGYSYINNVAVVAVPITAPGTTTTPINPAWVAAVAAAAVAVGTVVAVPNTYDVTEDDVAAIVAACAAQTSLLRELIPTAANRHPCEVLAMYFPGQDIGAALDTRINAIAANPSRILQQYSSSAETVARKGIRQGWGVNQPGCTTADSVAAQATYGTESVRCDEFPNFSMQDAGPGAYLKYVPTVDNSREGARYGTFVNAPVCTQRVKLPAYDQREEFAVIPVGLPLTFFTCGLRLG